MPKHKTRQITDKVIGNEKFVPIDGFPVGKLPTLKNVIDRCLYYRNYLTDKTLTTVSEEVFKLWIKYNVYPISIAGIRKILRTEMTEFSRLYRYDKSKREQKYYSDVDKFLGKTKNLFDVFQKDKNLRSEMEKQYFLKMTKADYQYYENQGTTRSGYCTLEPVPFTSTDIRFQSRIIQVEKAKANHETENNTTGGKRSYEALSDNSSATDEDKATDFDEFIAESDKTPQNRMSLPTLAMTCERFHVSDRVGAAIASAVLVDYGIITADRRQNVIDKNKLRAEIGKLRKKTKEEEKLQFKQVNGIGFDGRKDATLTVKEINHKYYKSTVLEDHYVVTGEPNDFYLDHFTPATGKGIDIAHGLWQVIQGTDLESKLTLVKADGTNVNTGCNKGAIRYLELFLQQPLQWDICMLHLNELPLRHILSTLDGSTKSPEKFSGPIGSMLDGSVSQWEVVNFKSIPYPSFPFLSNEVIDDLSTDQYYGYRMCWAIITGEVDEDLSHLEIGPLNHSRWLTLACRVLRFYISQANPTKNLCLIVQFVIKVYFHSWFDIKNNKKLTQGSMNLYNMIVRINNFPDQRVREICYKVLNNNSYFAHGENILVAMLADMDETVRRKAVKIILKLRENDEQVSEEEMEEEEEESDCDDPSNEKVEISSDVSKYPPIEVPVRVFRKPLINFKASSYHQMTPSSQWKTMPPVLKHYSNDCIRSLERIPLKFDFECHSQNIERHVKIVTEAAGAVCGHDRRDGHIRNKIKSRKLMKSFASKKYFNVSALE